MNYEIIRFWFEGTKEIKEGWMYKIIETNQLKIQR